MIIEYRDRPDGSESKLNTYTSSEDFEADKEKYTKIGFRVVTFADGQPDKNIHNGIKALIRNHIKEISQ